MQRCTANTQENRIKILDCTSQQRHRNAQVCLGHSQTRAVKKCVGIILVKSELLLLWRLLFKIIREISNKHVLESTHFNIPTAFNQISCRNFI